MHQKPKALSSSQAKTLPLNNPSATTFKSFRAELAELMKRVLSSVQELQGCHLEALPNRTLCRGCLSSPPSDSTRASNILQTKTTRGSSLCQLCF